MLENLKEVENKIVVLLNQGKKVQIEYNSKTGIFYMGEITTKKIEVEENGND